MKKSLTARDAENGSCFVGNSHAFRVRRYKRVMGSNRVLSIDFAPLLSNQEI